uniref:Putative tick til 21 n=1 Tax=Amblyomma cajennense TaxID=34607 RepID=A0A023FDM7_AMBCJ
MRTLLVVLASLLVLDVAFASIYIPKPCEPYWGAAEALSGCRRYEKCRQNRTTCGENNCASIGSEKPLMCTADFGYRCFCRPNLWRNRFGRCVRKDRCS